MQRLHRRTLVHELEDTAGLATGDAQRVREGIHVEAEQVPGGHGGPEHTRHAGRMEAARVGRGRVQGVADAHRHLVAGDDGLQQF